MKEGFQSVRDEMATKQDIGDLRQEMISKISIAKSELSEEIAGSGMRKKSMNCAPAWGGSRRNWA